LLRLFHMTIDRLHYYFHCRQIFAAFRPPSFFFISDIYFRHFLRRFCFFLPLLRYYAIISQLLYTMPLDDVMMFARKMISMLLMAHDAFDFFSSSGFSSFLFGF